MDGVLAGDKEGESTQNNQINEGGTMGVALLPESSVVDLSRMVRYACNAIYIIAHS